MTTFEELKQWLEKLDGRHLELKDGILWNGNCRKDKFISLFYNVNGCKTCKQKN